MNPNTAPQLATEFGSRLVGLVDGRQGLRGAMSMTVRDPQDGDGGMPDGMGGECMLDFVASDETLDRYDEVITASGWKLDNYKRNPVFQNSHKYGDIIYTLGKSVITEVRSGQLYQRVKFATDVNPMAKVAYGLYKGGFLNAVSVGFIPIKWENGTDQAGYRRKYLEQELLELSSVAVPANPNALVMGLKSGAIEVQDLRDSLDLVRSFVSPGLDALQQFRSNKAGSESNAGAPGVGPHGAQLLQLARDLNEVLKRA